MCGTCVDDQSVNSPVRGDRLHEHAARLDRVRDQPVLAVALAHGDGRLREQPVDLAGVERPRVAAVRAELVVDERRAVRRAPPRRRRPPAAARSRPRRARPRPSPPPRLVATIDRDARRRRSAPCRRERACASGAFVSSVGSHAHGQRALPLVGEVGARTRRRRRPACASAGVTSTFVIARVRVRAADDGELDHARDAACCRPTAPGPGGACRLPCASTGVPIDPADVDLGRRAHRPPPPRSPRRCSGSRCSGRCCPRARGGSRPRSGSGSPRAGSTAASTMPRRAVAALERVVLVEALLQRVERAVRRRGPRSSSISCPSAWTPSTVHDFTDSPSSSTVQAPHDEVSQPTTVPVRPSRSRRT